MAVFYVQRDREKILLSKRVFELLLKNTHAINYVAYKKAISENHLSFTDLRSLAGNVNIPYPLFFAPLEVVQEQILDDEANLLSKYPTKGESVMTPRGALKQGELDLIVRDLSKKQEFLKRRALITEPDNSYAGSQGKPFKLGIPNKEIAQAIRDFFQIELSEFRRSSKAAALRYLCDKVEAKNIYVSFSSYNYMPQNIARESLLSGICVKDKKFPWIFINTRDGDEKPLILESEGRQCFTLIMMLVCVAINLFVFSSRVGRRRSVNKRVFSITGEVLIPSEDISGLAINSLEELKYQAGRFKVTPSMMLFRLREEGLVSSDFAKKCREQLVEEVTGVSQNPRSPLPENAYGKYNGRRFSFEVANALKGKQINSLEAKNMLFRRGRVDAGMLHRYIANYVKI